MMLWTVWGGAQPLARADDTAAAARKLEDWKALVEVNWPRRDTLDANDTLELAGALRRIERAADAREVLRRGVSRLPEAEDLRAAWVDAALDDKQPATALQRIREARDNVRNTPQLRFRAARAYAALNQIVGDAQIRTLENARVGQFADDWLVLEKRDGVDRYWCCPENSALYQLRRAIDDGLDEPAAHLLHMELWRRVGRPRTALAILTAREQLLVGAADDSGLTQIADLAFELGQVGEFLRYSRLRADRATAATVSAKSRPATSRPAARAAETERKNEIMGSAYCRAAEKYAELGEPTLHAGMLVRALELRPDDVKLLVRTADAEWEAEQRDSARRHYQRALQLDRAVGSEERILRRLVDDGADTTDDTGN